MLKNLFLGIVTCYGICGASAMDKRLYDGMRTFKSRMGMAVCITPQELNKSFKLLPPLLDYAEKEKLDDWSVLCITEPLMSAIFTPGVFNDVAKYVAFSNDDVARDSIRRLLKLVVQLQFLELPNDSITRIRNSIESDIKLFEHIKDHKRDLYQISSTLYEIRGYIR